jgi:hypothetical protein
LYRAKHVYPYLKKKKFVLIRRTGSMALRVYFRAAAKRKEVVFITGVGHGSERVFSGDAGQSVLEVGKYGPEEAKNKIIHLLSCKTAGELGPDLVSKGALAFFGYSKNFTFRVGLESIFFACDSEIDLAIADGLKATGVYQRAKLIFEDQIDRLAGEDGQAAALLNADFLYLCCPDKDKMFGRRAARLA